MGEGTASFIPLCANWLEEVWADFTLGLYLVIQELPDHEPT